MTRAQYRMMKRILNGESLKISNYRPEHATIAALVRHMWIFPVDKKWAATWQGRDAVLRRVEASKPPPVEYEEMVA